LTAATTILTLLLPLGGAAGLIAAGSTAVSGSILEELASLPDEIEAYRSSHHPATSVAFWAESSRFGCISEGADEIRPAASTIKVFILIAAFLRFHEVWDEVPGELPDILLCEEGSRDPLEMMAASTRETVQGELWGMTYAQLAESMMGRNQADIGNSSYNAAASIIIFLLGGPGECTAAVRAIHTDFSSVRIGRYMLAQRTPENDNVASIRSLATACRLICAGEIPGIDEADCQEVSDCFQEQSFHGLANYQKHGHLSEAPSVNAWVGWLDQDENDYSIYCVSVILWDENTVEDEGADHYAEQIRERLYQLASD
jgi:hypothetical protein